MEYSAGSVHLRANVPEEIARRVRAEYAAYDAMCASIDQNVGRMLHELDEVNLARETIVVFTSDHGDMLGSHGLEDKDVWYEEAVRIPLLIRYPALLPSGKVHDELISNADLAPTLLTLCGVQALEGTQGQDVAATLAGSGTEANEEAVFAEGKLNSADEWRMVVRGADKLVLNREMEPTHLYNLAQDPFEMENLATGATHQLKRDELKALTAAWMRRTEYRMDASGLKKRS